MSALAYRAVPPPADLRWAVECLWSAEGPVGSTERIVPDGCPELLLQLGGTMAAPGRPVTSGEAEPGRTVDGRPGGTRRGPRVSSADRNEREINPVPRRPER